MSLRADVELLTSCAEGYLTVGVLPRALRLMKSITCLICLWRDSVDDTVRESTLIKCVRALRGHKFGCSRVHRCVHLALVEILGSNVEWTA